MYRARYCVGNGMTPRMEKPHRCLPQKVNCHDPTRETLSFEFCVVYFYRFTSTSNCVVLIKQSWLVWPFCKVHPPQRWCFSKKHRVRCGQKIAWPSEGGGSHCEFYTGHLATRKLVFFGYVFFFVFWKGSWSCSQRFVWCRNVRLE